MKFLGISAESPVFTSHFSGRDADQFRPSSRTANLRLDVLSINLSRIAIGFLMFPEFAD